VSGKRRISLEARFWGKVDKQQPDDACWLWTAGIFWDGYGKFFGGPARRCLRAHRMAWELVNGPIPVGAMVLHHCDNPLCVRPDHLFLGDALINSQDAWSKRRNVFQTRGNPSEKLSVEQVVEIRRRRNAGESLARLSSSFGVAESMVCRIARGQRRGETR